MTLLLIHRFSFLGALLVGGDSGEILILNVLAISKLFLSVWSLIELCDHSLSLRNSVSSFGLSHSEVFAPEDDFMVVVGAFVTMGDFSSLHKTAQEKLPFSCVDGLNPGLPLSWPARRPQITAHWLVYHTTPKTLIGLPHRPPLIAGCLKGRRSSNVSPPFIFMPGFRPEYRVERQALPLGLNSWQIWRFWRFMVLYCITTRFVLFEAFHTSVKHSFII